MKNINSIIWQENNANDLPSYAHEEQKLFFNEATQWCEDILVDLDKYNLKFRQDDKTEQKATWMLFLNCVLQIRECLSLIVDNKILSSSPLLREILEKFHAILFFNDKGNKSALDRFFDDKGDYYFTDSKYYKNHSSRQELEKFFSSLSKFVHPNYMGLREFFCLGGDNSAYIYSAYMTTFGQHKTTSGLSLVPPDKISQHFWIIAQFIKEIDKEKEKIINWIEK